MKYNKFIDKHDLRFCLYFVFHDYRLAKNNLKGQSLTEQKTGKIVPTPNALIRVFAKTVSGDTAVKSEMNGVLQRLILADKREFLRIVGKGSHKNIKKDNGTPCSLSAQIEISMDKQMSLARMLNLM